MEDIAEALGGEQDCAISFAHCLQPIAETVAEQIVTKINPRFIERHERGGSVEAPLDLTEEIEQHGDDGFIAQSHQVLRLKREKPPRAEHVLLGIEERSHGTGQCVVLKSIADFKILDIRAEFRECSRRRKPELLQRGGQRIPLPGAEFKPLYYTKSFKPIDSPGELGIGINLSQGAKCKRGTLARDVVELPTGGAGQHIQAVALIERKNLRSRIAEPLRDYQRE